MKFLHFILIASAISWCHVASGWAIQQPIAIIYPDVAEPYGSIFRKIVGGIEDELVDNVEIYSVRQETDVERIRNRVGQESFGAIIALGRGGIFATRSIGTHLPVVVGALPLTPSEKSGISLEPDPAILFSRLNQLAPHIKRIRVVYSSRNQWLIRLAEEVARERSMVLLAEQVEDLRSAVHRYRVILQDVDPLRDAIWVPLDSVTSNEEVILPLLLQTSWDKRILMFSSKPSHAQRGALFSMYPDYYGLGCSLARMARKTVENPKFSEVLPLRDLKMAVNLRTAAHIGLRFSTRQQEDFKLVFPAR
ncbi:MAG: ABC transporter substrate-binding protein [Desulfuromonas sp.]|nr:MAG: ABC transporter substrate-binding protein [Desulfuromonas sp.]